MKNKVKHELHNILRGTGEIGPGNLIQAAAGYLRRNAEAGKVAPGSKRDKKEEAESLKRFATENSLFLSGFSSKEFVSAGAEQRVFISDSNSVFKMNEAIYFENLTDYFYNLLLNNWFFPETAYNLKGFVIEQEVLYAVVHQNFIKADEPTNLEKVKLFYGSQRFPECEKSRLCA